MSQCGYVLAGFETLATIMDNFVEGRRGRWEENFTRPDLSNFLSSVTAGFLHSYGQDFPGKVKYDKHDLREANTYQTCRDWGFFDGCNFIVDSGGFQISIGRLTRKESDLLYKMYYNWLTEYKDLYDRAFILDIPPGPGCEIFHNFDDVFKLNLESYQKAKNLPKEVRDKIIYVHHFRTPQLWRIYTKIMREYDMFDSFQYHATGGIVANMASDMSIPCIIYVLPLIPLLNEAKKAGRKYLNFHILGGANFRDVMFYELFMEAVKKKHDIDLNITYDSSGIYKQVMVARFIYVKDENGYYSKMSIKSDQLHLNNFGSMTVEQKLQMVLNNFAKRWNFKPITMDGVYDPARDTFWEDIKLYTMLYTLDLYHNVQVDVRKFVKDNYHLYDSHNYEDFYHQCLEITRVINQGKLTKKQKIKTHSIAKSLDMLTDLDEEFCKYIVDKYLSKDEFVELDPTTKVLTI